MYRTVTAANGTEASALHRAFVEEVSRTQLPEDRGLREITVDEAVELFLTEYLSTEKGRADKTVDDYRRLHCRWKPGPFVDLVYARSVERRWPKSKYLWHGNNRCW